MFWARPLIYHELVPGHHFQLSLQQENKDLPPIQRYGGGLSLTAFVEGWAEYASILAGEMGLYESAYDRYGRLVMDAFAAARLVVDTGVHSQGWSLEQARRYMQENTFASDTEIDSEILRYSTDIPGQAISYAVGPMKIQEFRAEAERVLGDEFDIRQFHAAALSSGALPLDLLEWHLSIWTKSLTEPQPN